MIIMTKSDSNTNCEQYYVQPGKTCTSVVVRLSVNTLIQGLTAQAMGVEILCYSFSNPTCSKPVEKNTDESGARV